MNREKPKSSIERVVGNIDKKEKRKILRAMDEEFGDQAYNESRGLAREKTPEELQMIALADDLTNEARRKYGLADFNVPPGNIHVLEKEQWAKVHRGKFSAFYSATLQGISMKEEPARILFTRKAIHEMLHFKSYNAVQVDSPEKENAIIYDYRVGLATFTRDWTDKHFKSLNEAVTEEMTKRALIKIFTNPLFADEVRAMRELISANPKIRNGADSSDAYYYEKTSPSKSKLMDPRELYLLANRRRTDVPVKKPGKLASPEKNPGITVHKFSYEQERRILNTLIDKILRRNPDKFKNREEVFDIFARGMMTGNILPIGRLLDSTFGRGTFDKFSELDKRQIADRRDEDPDNVNTQEEFVRSL